MISLHTSSAYPGCDEISAGILARTDWPFYRRYLHSGKDQFGHTLELVYWLLWHPDALLSLSAQDSPLDAVYDPSASPLLTEFGDRYGEGQIVLITPIIGDTPYLFLCRRLDGTKTGPILRARDKEEAATRRRLRVTEQR